MVGRVHAVAGIARGATAIVVGRSHTQTALAADQKPGQQRAASAHRTDLVGPVGSELCQIALELVPTDVGRRPVWEENLRLIRLRWTSPRAWPPRFLTPSID